MCDNIEHSDIILQRTGILSIFDRCDTLGPTTKLQTQVRFISNRIDKDFIPNVTINYDCCEHLGYRLKLDTRELSPEVTLKNTSGNLNAFRYPSHSVDQVQKLIIHDEAHLNKDHKIDHLIFFLIWEWQLW
jgi:hypothetical protein